ncbi:MAG: RDD family protein [Stenotrophomonas nitritireducens]|uniref:RDD family protein n=1 Tax=Stenotrophomonas nitritireducens TaxID=83617 RepID=A0A9D8L171_9GAMM|nr:RDD family protein [Stenotrophomonas nitritireducens]
MSQWYYADARRERHGPVEADTLRDKFRRNELDLYTLIWREGMPQWQPLSAMAEELQLLVQADTGGGIDLRADYQAIEDGTAVAKASAAAAIAESPYAAPGSVTLDTNRVIASGDVVHAGFLRRLAASLVDSFVTGIITWILLIPIMLLMGVGLGTLANPDNIASLGAMLGFQGLMYLVSFLVPCLYFGWMQSSTSMASLGKMVVGIKVVRGNGERASFWRNFLRYLAMMVFGMVTCYVGFLITAFMVAMTERKQGLHDMICDTLVVDKWAFTDHPQWQQRGLGTATIVILSIFGLLVVGGTIAMLALIGIASSKFS